MEVTEVKVKAAFSKRLALLGAVLAAFVVGSFFALGVRSLVVPAASADPAVPNPGHEWSEVGLPPGTWPGLDADMVDGYHASELGGGGITYSAPSRALDTIYQNTSGKWRMVMITGSTTGVSAGLHGTILGQIGTSSPPATNVGWITTDFSSPAGGSANTWGMIVFFVPPEWYYRALSSPPSSLGAWWEADFQ